MIVKHFSITSSGDSELLIMDDLGSNNPNYTAGDFYTIKRLLICNTDNADITANVWIKIGTDVYYIVEGVTIPVRTTIDILDGEDLVYSGTNRLYMNLGSSGDTADVTLNVY